VLTLLTVLLILLLEFHASNSQIHSLRVVGLSWHNFGKVGLVVQNHIVGIYFHISLFNMHSDYLPEKYDDYRPQTRIIQWLIQMSILNTCEHVFVLTVFITAVSFTFLNWCLFSFTFLHSLFVCSWKLPLFRLCKHLFELIWWLQSMCTLRVVCQRFVWEG